MAKTIGKAIAKFRNAQEEMSGVLKGEMVFDKDAEDPFKSPLDALDEAAAKAKKGADSAKKAASAVSKKASATTKKSTSTAAAGAAAAAAAKAEQGACEADKADAAPAKPESFAERKARYDKERAERKAAEEAELKKKEEEERKAAAEARKAEAAKKREEAAAKRKAEAEAKKAAEEAKAVTEAAGRGLLVCGHLMAGLPGEGEADFLASVDWAASLPLHGLKLHNVYVPKGTELARQYRAGNYLPLERDEYVDLLCAALPRIPSRLVMHRLQSDPAPGELVAPAWAARKRPLLGYLLRALDARDLWQGCRADAPEERPGWYDG